MTPRAVCLAVQRMRRSLAGECIECGKPHGRHLGRLSRCEACLLRRKLRHFGVAV
jgi:hypothetical protein